MRALPLIIASLLLDLVYLLVFLLLVPWLLFLIVVRGRGVGSLAERLGSVPIAPPTRPRVWFHAVSVGEVEAALPLIKMLEAERPDLEVVISTTTTTAHRVAVEKGEGRAVFLFPLDFGVCVRRTLRRVRPTLLVLVELELWPNLILNCRARRVPVVVANGRISASGFSRMKKVALLLRPFARRVDRYLVQNSEYGDRLQALGVAAEAVTVTGNLKFDRAPIADPGAVRERFEIDHAYARGGLRWIAGCTHPGEEAIVLDAHERLRAVYPDLTLILAPRHVERGGEIETSVVARGFSVARWSAGPAATADVLIVDEVGRLAQLYACADVAFVGGSLIPRGGHNVLEPVLAGTPATHGPFTSNFKEVVGLLTPGGATVEVADSEQLAATVGAWLGDPGARRAHAERGTQLLEAHRGVARRTAKEMAAFLPMAQ
ncbi:MAG: 3-deoxy-D-manno-octulosonic acid transferase [Planctomycetota bacterium]